jgi:23S rRNA (pseudouridine1915-N3)-methyltransferase
MRLVVAAVGRLKQGPERDLAQRYRERIAKTGRTVGVQEIELIEIAESRAREAQRRKTEESIALAQLIPEGAAKVLLDERGEDLDSAAFTKQLQRWRDQGRSAAVFLIGGPDGVAPNLREDADLCLAFGAATWPHQLVRIMLLEQLYRAVTILAGHPYHRGG